MSSRHAIATATKITLSQECPLGYTMLVLKLPETSNVVPWGALADGHNDALNGQRFVWCQIESHNEPELSPQFQLKYCDVWAMLLVGLHKKAWQLPVENRHASEVAAWNICCYRWKCFNVKLRENQ